MASKIPKLDCSHETEEGEDESYRGNWDSLPPELLNMIFNNLIVPDLLSCSVVSKTWKKASRDVLKRSRVCYAYIRDFPQHAYDLVDKFLPSTDLMQMVNGLYIQMRPKDSNENSIPLSSSSSFCQQVIGFSNIKKSKEARRKLMNVALSLNQMRYLTLDIEDNCEEDISSSDLSLLRELISHTSESLHILSLWQAESCDLMSSCAKEFSSLKGAVVQYNKGGLEYYLLKDFLTAFAPNLEEIRGEMLIVAINYPGNQFMLKRSKSLLVFHDDMNPNLCIEDYRCISGLHRLDLRVCHCNSFEGDNILYSMVLKSLDTLEELRIYTPELYNWFRTSEIQLKFPKLRRLSLATHQKMPLGNEIGILKQLNLAKLCPKLVQLELCLDQGYHKDDVYKEEDWTLAALPSGTDRSDVPLQIEFEYREGHYSHEYFELLTEIYPKIKKVYMRNWKLRDSIHEVSRIFSDVPSLEYLQIVASYYHPPDIDFQMDALLCGIGTEEVQFLFHSSPSTNNAELIPSIVPTRPSLFNAKNLKELKISDGESDPEDDVNRSWVIQVTEYHPARHVRNVKVTFEGTDDMFNRLNRLRAFTTLHCAQSSLQIKT